MQKSNILTRCRRILPLAIFCLLAALALAACGDDDDDNSTATPTTSGSPVDASPTGTAIETPAGTGGEPVECSASEEQIGTVTTLVFDQDTGSYDPGDSIEMTLTLANCAENEVTFSYNTTQRYVFLAQDPDGNEVWSSADNKVFEQVEGEETLAPNSTIVYTETWDQKDRDGEQVADGQYKISAFSIGCSAGQADCRFGPVRFVQIGEVEETPAES